MDLELSLSFPSTLPFVDPCLTSLPTSLDDLPGSHRSVVGLRTRRKSWAESSGVLALKENETEDADGIS